MSKPISYNSHPSYQGDPFGIEASSSQSISYSSPSSRIPKSSSNSPNPSSAFSRISSASSSAISALPRSSSMLSPHPSNPLPRSKPIAAPAILEFDPDLDSEPNILAPLSIPDMSSIGPASSLYDNDEFPPIPDIDPDSLIMRTRNSSHYSSHFRDCLSEREDSGADQFSMRPPSSLISYPEQVEILEYYYRQAQVDAEYGGPESEKWADLIARQELALAAFDNPGSPRFAPAAAVPVEAENPPFVDGDKSLYQKYPGLGQIGFVQDLEVDGRRIDRVYLRPYPISREILDASRNPEVRLLSSSRGQFVLRNNPAAQTCFDNMGKIDSFFRDVFHENPVNNMHTPMRAYLNSKCALNNACWAPANCAGIDSDQQQAVHFGPMDPNIYKPFVTDFSITAHEFGHAVNSYTAKFNYNGESGALDESGADVFSIMAQHYQNKALANGPDTEWLIGKGVRVNAIRGVALRSIKDPDAGYSSQPDNYANCKHLRPDEKPSPHNNNGYRHHNCSIPSKAFCESAIGIGGPTYGTAGKIWHRALTKSREKDNFSNFALGTLKAVKELRLNNGVENAVGQAWTRVGVDLRAFPRPGPAPMPAPVPRRPGPAPIPAPAPVPAPAPRRPGPAPVPALRDIRTHPPLMRYQISREINAFLLEEQQRMIEINHRINHTTPEPSCTLQ